MAESGVGTIDSCAAIQRIVGDAHVHAAENDPIDGVQPRWVVEPADDAELAGVLAAANAAGLRIIARGSGTKLGWGNPPTAADLIVSTKRLNRVIEHAAANMTATVQAGATVCAFAQALSRRGQRLAVDPLFSDRATIGGILATNDSGALRTTFGSLRDHLIGITVALADGTIARSGGKVVKNVAGYDLPKLFIGSFGTLGIITEATFRLYPVAQATRTLRFETPTEELLQRTLQAMRDCSLITTAVQVLADHQSKPSVQVLIEGLTEAIEQKVLRVNSFAQMIAKPCINWKSPESLFETAETSIAKLSVLPTQIPDVLNQMCQIDLPWSLIAQINGVGHLSLKAAKCEQLADAWTSLRDGFKNIGGTLTVLRAPPDVKRNIDVWPEVGDALPMMRRIKEQFDPSKTLSPGRFVGGI